MEYKNTWDCLKAAHDRLGRKQKASASLFLCQQLRAEWLNMRHEKLH